MRTWIRAFTVFLVITQPLYLAAKPVKPAPSWDWKKIALVTGTTIIGITAIVLASYGIYKKKHTTNVPVVQPPASELPINPARLKELNRLLQVRHMPPTNDPRRLTLQSKTLSTTTAAYTGDYELLQSL